MRWGLVDCARGQWLPSCLLLYSFIEITVTLSYYFYYINFFFVWMYVNVWVQICNDTCRDQSKEWNSILSFYLWILRNELRSGPQTWQCIYILSHLAGPHTDILICNNWFHATVVRSLVVPVTMGCKASNVCSWQWTAQGCWILSK